MSLGFPQELTVCDTSQSLVERWRVAVIRECDTNSSRQKPPGQSEGLFILQQPVPEALVVHFVALQQHRIQHEFVAIKQGNSSSIYVLFL